MTPDAVKFRRISSTASDSHDLPTTAQELDAYPRPPFPFRAGDIVEPRGQLAGELVGWNEFVVDAQAMVDNVGALVGLARIDRAEGTLEALVGQ